METKKFLNLIPKLGKSEEVQSNGKYLLINGISLIAAGSILSFFWPKLPPQVPLFYSKPWGEAQLAKPYFLAVPLLMSAVFLILNLLLTQKLDNYIFLKKSLIFGTTIISVLASVAVIRIVLLII
ncbi:MAG: hypothetical protein A3D24_02615 [Candidatus Blackburnbacteria bacterium RIFCSPHIGHO2_02_FULL_39_13]|uniref:DUF1648 domain-containing protein n=1 Tax=Candidatus Blackburnbacteria bacterium RIFCSPLOWO2_01_FULL_40_20 TaxID=1797519 RepID=A0A1G1VF42_9BACT|nr:MAG: hypothetical protein UT38_C0008G0007 [Microgenomates group bacterium GW2011_GWA2_39_19]OGY07257.1 MAG: hypothetical protein A2694_00110 [Candidatus Blackburnbacteria bacterium RIFCSPHIGHO2_01_FULL_40_17]OGY09271.1 MAG: hypothetical protein A3D24_02615 [Candidatus Blackburnbacteria bacterium RIFCSPHIGHO2_02_FULL_39_13]OGY13896.1 MAG: hypothetical protein A3A77_01205 [Candidatus Blackburnbacteria bacterium RIFCSPLOWO2_01_FULL_40_20]OGY14936.1 MAG: hypothetical protein A3I52_02685 [Candida